MSTPDFVVAIPARHASTRLPGKPLLPIGGEPMVLHVARRALAAGAREVWVATDDARIADALDGRGVRVAMTSAEHASGTDRLAECAA
ncbi:MAG: NTP transferase domain-containing protein, partial [Xanthomonadales bacterium]|nr:NTP transferase domain-containing protein [Xanthomonadales bacterium]